MTAAPSSPVRYCGNDETRVCDYTCGYYGHDKCAVVEISNSLWAIAQSAHSVMVVINNIFRWYHYALTGRWDHADDPVE